MRERNAFRLGETPVGILDLSHFKTVKSGKRSFPTPALTCNSRWSFFSSNRAMAMSRVDGAYGMPGGTGMNLTQNSGSSSLTCTGAVAPR